MTIQEAKEAHDFLDGVTRWKVYQNGFKDGMKAGLVEGERRERRALRRWVYSASRYSYLGEVKDWVADRARKGRKK